MQETKRLRAYLRLHLADGVGPILSKRLRDAFGDIEEIFKATPSQLCRVEGIGEKTAQAIAAVGDADVDAELAEAARGGAEVLCVEDEQYPAALKTIHDYPAVLYVRGQLQATDALAMAIVGSRRCTHYGMEQAERFGGLLGRAGFTVVSGGARGIDTAAHRGSLSAGGRTIAVMGCGLGQVYPPENKAFFAEMLDSGRGVLVSELPMRTTVLAGNFPMRNRIISGLSLGVLVVEAAAHSGSLITAREAAEQGRQVFALPGRVDSPFSQGTNELIRSGVTLVANLEHILEQLGPVGEKMHTEEQVPQRLVVPGLTREEERLLGALGEGPLGLDDLVRRTGVPSGLAASAMILLVLKGAVTQQAGNIFRLRQLPKD